MIRRLACLVPPIAYLGIAFADFGAAWQDPSALLIGGGNDPKQTMWALGWPLHALSYGQNPWLTDYLDYPGGINLTLALIHRRGSRDRARETKNGHTPNCENAVVHANNLATKEHPFGDGIIAQPGHSF